VIISDVLPSTDVACYSIGVSVIKSVIKQVNHSSTQYSRDHFLTSHKCEDFVTVLRFFADLINAFLVFTFSEHTYRKTFSKSLVLRVFRNFTTTVEFGSSVISSLNATRAISKLEYMVFHLCSRTLLAGFVYSTTIRTFYFFALFFRKIQTRRDILRFFPGDAHVFSNTALWRMQAEKKIADR